MLFKFSQDDIVVPRESSWFGFFDGKQLVDMKDSALYKVRISDDFCIVYGRRPDSCRPFRIQGGGCFLLSGGTIGPEASALLF